MNELVTLSFTMYSRSPYNVGEAAEPNPPVVSNAPSSVYQTVSPLMFRAAAMPAVPK